MLRFGSFPACILMFGLTTACTNSPAPDTREADVHAVRDVEAAWVKDIGAKDVEKFVAYYADDATLLMPNAAALNGKEAIRAALKPMLADPNFSLTFQDTRAAASKGGDFVYTTGAYTMTVSAPKNPKSVTTDKGKYLTVFRKQPDGSWKAVADMINSDLPLAQPAKRTSKRSRGRR
jgi:uncharacterized protein (TIGR02246 family)